MAIDDAEWSKLEPAEATHERILAKCEENPNTAFSVADLDEVDDAEPEEDAEDRSGHEEVAFEVTHQVVSQVYREKIRTVCDQLVYEGKLEKRVDDDKWTDYYRIADS